MSGRGIQPSKAAENGGHDDNEGSLLGGPEGEGTSVAMRHLLDLRGFLIE